MKAALILVAILFCTNVAARNITIINDVAIPFTYVSPTYYISMSGSDSNNGQSPYTPWQTCNRATTIPQYSSLLFQRGNTFNCFLPLKNRNITYLGAYGLGPDPIISGIIDVPSTAVWQDIGNGIYSLDLSTIGVTNVGNVFVNDQPVDLARHPNRNIKTGRADFYRSTAYNSTSINFTMSDFVGQDIVNATVIIRNTDWQFTSRQAIGWINGNGTVTVNLNDNTFSAEWDGFGFFFQGKKWMIDALNEWIVLNGFLLLKNSKPNAQKIQLSTVDTSFVIPDGTYNNIIESLFFDRQYTHGVNLLGCTNCTVKNCTFQGQIKAGLRVSTPGRHITVTTTLFRNISGEGLWFGDNYNSIITNNTFLNIGLDDWQGIRDVESAGICSSGQTYNVFTAYNNFSDMGYAGIVLNGNGTINNNIAVNCMLRMSDGAAIYCGGSKCSGMIIQSNNIYNCPGDGLGTGGSYSGIGRGSGIYVDFPLPTLACLTIQ